MIANILLAVVITTLVAVIVVPAHKLTRYMPWLMSWLVVLTICAVMLGLIE